MEASTVQATRHNDQTNQAIIATQDYSRIDCCSIKVVTLRVPAHHCAALRTCASSINLCSATVATGLFQKKTAATGAAWGADGELRLSTLTFQQNKRHAAELLLLHWNLKASGRRQTENLRCGAEQQDWAPQEETEMARWRDLTPDHKLVALLSPKPEEIPPQLTAFRDRTWGTAAQTSLPNSRTRSNQLRFTQELKHGLTRSWAIHSDPTGKNKKKYREFITNFWNLELNLRKEQFEKTFKHAVLKWEIW